MGLFSNLKKVGLGELEEMEVYDEEKKQEAEEKAEAKEAASEEPKKPQVQEEQFLFDRKATCPVCDKEFQSKVVRSGRMRMLSSDTDLRPRYQFDSLKYDVVACPHCGYASLSRFFKFMTPAQAELIRDNITKTFKGIDTECSTYSYDEAIMRYQLALVNSVVKKAKTSEKAYTCLKTAWIYRGKAESLADEDAEKNAEEIKKLNRQEAELMKKACEGFKTAFTTEEFPMCGMDELTVTYLIAELCRRTGLLEESGRWISRVLTTRGAADRIKNKARDIKELLEEDKKALEKKAQEKKAQEK